MPNTPFVITNPCNDKDWLDIKKKKKKTFQEKICCLAGTHPVHLEPGLQAAHKVLDLVYKLLTKSWTCWEKQNLI